MASTRPEPIRIAELLGALSLVTDLAQGNPPEHAASVTLLSLELARRLGVEGDALSDVYYTALLKHVGCTAQSHEEGGWLGGEDIVAHNVGARTDFRRPQDALSWIGEVARELPPRDRARVRASAMLRGRTRGRIVMTANCDVAANMARRLGLREGVRQSLFHHGERWDGRGLRRVRGDEIPVPMRIAQVADQALMALRLGGEEAARRHIEARRGAVVDPEIADLFLAARAELVAASSPADPVAAVAAAEPEPPVTLPASDIDIVARAFADAVDLKTPVLHGHSSGVAVLAERAAEAMGLGADRVTAIRRAALLHDIGRVGLPVGTWEQPEPLTESQRERVRLHAYHAERILARSHHLAPLAAIVGMHHERQDGSGYHRQAKGGDVPAEARILAAADVYDAMTHDRPHRPAVPVEVAAKELGREAKAGRLDPEAVRCVLVASGRSRARRRSYPAGLSDREVEVLRLLAGGRSTKEIARLLVISSRTAEHHIEHIYVKAAVSSRAGAALFAMEHDLLEH